MVLLSRNIYSRTYMRLRSSLYMRTNRLIDSLTKSFHRLYSNTISKKKCIVDDYANLNPTTYVLNSASVANNVNIIANITEYGIIRFIMASTVIIPDIIARASPSCTNRNVAINNTRHVNAYNIGS